MIHDMIVPKITKKTINAKMNKERTQKSSFIFSHVWIFECKNCIEREGKIQKYSSLPFLVACINWAAFSELFERNK